MAGSHHGSILKIDMNWQMKYYFSGLNWNMQFLRDGKKTLDYSDINKSGLYQNHHVIKGARILSLDKFSKEICSILISDIVNKPTSNIYFQKLFKNTTLDWSKVYLSPCLANINTTLRSFQYEAFNIVSFLNKNMP